MVYVLHFHTPLAHARHYVGSCTNIGRRLCAHRMGHGARITQVCLERGITWELVALLPGGRVMERKLKARHNGPRLCPICNPKLREGGPHA